MHETYYVAAGLFNLNGAWDSYEFALVRPSGKDHCYITKNANGLQLTQHHASLYSIKETAEGYVLFRVRHDILNSPPYRVLHKGTELYDYLRNSIRYAEENNKFYE